MSKKPSAPTRSVPTSGFVDTMAASQQAHIDQLVQQNRTLQHAVKKLQSEFTNEQTRSRQAVQRIQEQWHAERLQWQEGCDTLQACHKLEYLRAIMDLEKEKQNVITERNATRTEKLARLQRDFKLTMFQAKEVELERQIAELEDELRGLQEIAKAHEGERSAALKEVKAELADYVDRAEADAQRYADIGEERDQLQEELGKAREDNANLQVTYDSLSTRLDRTTLQLEGSKTTIEEMRQKNDELTRMVAELKRQLDQWKELETRGGAEADLHRKKRVELENQLRQLEGKSEQVEKREEELAAALEKEKLKSSKLRETALQWKETAEAYEADMTALQEREAQLQTEIESLQTELATERVISRPARARKPHAPSDDEIEEISPPQTQQVPKTKKASGAKPPKSDGKPPSNARPKRHLSPVVEIEAGPSSVHEQPPSSSGDSADEVEELAMPTSSIEANSRGKEKAKSQKALNIEEAPAKKRGKRKAAHNSDESDIEISEAGKRTDTEKSKGKRVMSGSDVEELKSPPKASRSKPVSKSAAPTRIRKRKPSPEPDADEDEPKAKGKKMAGAPKKLKEKPAPPPQEDEPPAEAQPKKKRKINIFPTTQTGSFNFVGDALGGGILGIPTELSPIKDTQAVPSRSISTNGVRSRLAESITRRR